MGSEYGEPFLTWCDFHKILNTEEKRRGVEALGSEMIGKLTYYERWIAAFANILFQKRILAPSELARKMDEVAARFKADANGDFAFSFHPPFEVPGARYEISMHATKADLTKDLKLVLFQKK